MLESLLTAWRKAPDIAQNIASWSCEPARDAATSPLPADMSVALATALRRRRIVCLYTHQNEAWRFSKAGDNVVVVTGTASGKTMCYNLPIVDAALQDAQSCALYLFPTKALTYDQHKSLNELCTEAAGIAGAPAPKVAVYDGDTPPSLRTSIRREARLLLTNPDMLHMAILPHHTLWADFFRRLRFVVIDEIHHYRGVFGSHVANLVRRLKRVAGFYQSAPRFILTSATIANPATFAAKLIEEPVRVVEQDGSPRGARDFLIYNPPLVDEQWGVREDSREACRRLAGDLLAENLQCLLFAPSRRLVEFLLRDLQHRYPHRIDELYSYRSGYLTSDRRAIEQFLRDGKARLVVATNALELGIDIGGMQAVLLAGYPGSIAAIRQQSGRAGRRQERSLAVLVASADPLDQFLVRHPDYLHGRSPEQALINPDNQAILLQHLRCAAFELPFSSGQGFGKLEREAVAPLFQALQQVGLVHAVGDRIFWIGEEYPADRVSLRNMGGDIVSLVAVDERRQTVIGELDWQSALTMTHPGAIYLQEGRTYRVNELLSEEKKALLEAVDSDYYTEPKKKLQIQRLAVHRSAAVAAGEKFYGEVLVSSQVTGFRKIKWDTHETFAAEPLDMPCCQLQTAACWFTVSEQSIATLQASGLWNSDANDYGPDWPGQRDLARARDGYVCRLCGAQEQGRAHHIHHRTPFRLFPQPQQANHLDNLLTLCARCHQRMEAAVRVHSGLAGLGYVIRKLAPLFLMCDSHDVATYTDARLELGEYRPTVVLYDRIAGGIGLSESFYQLHENFVAHAHELVAGCRCPTGCPSCVGPAGEAGYGSKKETLALLVLLCAPTVTDVPARLAASTAVSSTATPPEPSAMPADARLEASIRLAVAGIDKIENASGVTWIRQLDYDAETKHGIVRLDSQPDLSVLLQWGKTYLTDADIGDLLFLDTETTGLAGGTGTLAFLIGIGFRHQRGFRLQQFFLHRPDAEPALLEQLAQTIARFPAVVTFNGKSFDAPLLNTRYVMNGRRSPLENKSHFDMLQLARRLWKQRLPSRALADLERDVLQFRRSGEDIAGWLIPQMYAGFLRSQDARPLAGVFYHNAIDLVSLYALFLHTSGMLSDPHQATMHAQDLLAVAGIYDELQKQEAAALYEKSLQSGLPVSLEVKAMHALAALHRRAGDKTKAIDLWEKAAQRQDIDACVALAKYHEHEIQDTATALHWTRQAIGFLADCKYDEATRNRIGAELEHRAARLQHK